MSNVVLISTHNVLNSLSHKPHKSHRSLAGSEKIHLSLYGRANRRRFLLQSIGAVEERDRFTGRNLQQVHLQLMLPHAEDVENAGVQLRVLTGESFVSGSVRKGNLRSRALIEKCIKAVTRLDEP
ncbi:uncharacterized [Tachysurus ichikawai]